MKETPPHISCTMGTGVERKKPVVLFSAAKERSHLFANQRVGPFPQTAGCTQRRCRLVAQNKSLTLSAIELSSRHEVCFHIPCSKTRVPCARETKCENARQAANRFEFMQVYDSTEQLVIDETVNAVAGAIALSSVTQLPTPSCKEVCRLPAKYRSDACAMKHVLRPSW